MAQPAPEVPLHGATARRAPCQRRVRAVVPPSHRFDWTGPGVCGRGGARAGDAATMVSSNREAKPPSPHPPGSSFCARRTRPGPIPGLQGGFKMQVGLGGGGDRWER